MNKIDLANGIRLIRSPDRSFSNCTETFLFDSEDALSFAMAILYHGDIASATAISSGGIYVLQVKSERMERRARKLFHKHFYLTHFENLPAYDIDGNKSFVNAHYCVLLHPITKAMCNDRMYSIRNVSEVGA